MSTSDGWRGNDLDSSEVKSRMMSDSLPDIRKVSVLGKRVIVRCDLDVPLTENKEQRTENWRPRQTRLMQIADDTRLKSSLPTIKYLLKNGAKVIIIGHAGRPEGEDKSYSLEPVARWYLKNINPDQIGVNFQKVGELKGWELAENLFILENLRFYKGEEENDPEFSRKLANLGEIYVNEAFAVVHRAHASIIGLPALLPHYSGIHLQKEIEVLSLVLKEPKRPLVVVIGGAKIETKLPLLKKMHHLADYVLVGGKIASETRELIRIQHEKLTGIKSILLVGELAENGLDLTPQSIENFLQVINTAKTVVWNGPVGKVGEEGQSQGSKILAEGILKSKAYTVVGGGDTVGFLRDIKLLDKFSFVSSGGGAMLSFLSGEKLPGVEALLAH